MTKASKACPAHADPAASSAQKVREAISVPAASTVDVELWATL